MRRGLLVGLTAASVGVIYGYDLGGMASALSFVAERFGLTTQHKELVMTTAVIGQIAGALGGGVLANAIGRKNSTVLITACYAVFALLGALSVSLPMLLVARLLLGVTLGVSMVVVPVYIAESAPAAVRGSLATAYQLAIVSGLIVGYLAGYLLAGMHSWRWMLGLAAVPATMLMPLLLRLPDTARWYLLRGRVDEARRALRQLEPEPEVDAELTEISSAASEEEVGLKAGVAEMLRRPYLRATAFVVALGSLSQVTGVNAIVYYGNQLLGFEGNVALLVLAMVQVPGLAAVRVSLRLVDRLGRRPVLLCGIAMMIAADVVMVVAFAWGVGGPSPVLGFAGVLLFIIGFNFGFGSLVWVYAGEAFPARLRSLGSSTLLTANLVGNAVVAAGFLTMRDFIGGAGAFAVLGVLAAVAFVVVYRYAPETKGRQLEEIRHYWENGGRWP